MSIQNLLRAEIQTEMEELNKIQLGTEEYRARIDGLTKLIDREIEIEKLSIDDHVKDEELRMKREQMEQERRDRWIKNGITIGGILIPAGITIWGTLKSLKFEETGTVTTVMGRGFLNKLLPKK